MSSSMEACPDEVLLAEDLHGDDPHPLRVRAGRASASKLWSAMGMASALPSSSPGHARAGEVERHLHAVEVVALEGLLHGQRVRVAGDADEARHLLVPRLHHRLEDSALRLDGRQVVAVGEGVDVDDVEVVGLEALQAELQLAPGVVGGAGAELGGEDDLLAPRRHQLADPLLALAVAVAVGGVDVGHAQVDRPAEDAERLLVRLVGDEAAARAEGEDRDVASRSRRRDDGGAGPSPPGPGRPGG